MPHFYSFAELGKVASSWGITSNDTHELIKNAKHDDKVVWLLARISQQLDELAAREQRETPCPISIGHARGMQTLRGEIPWKLFADELSFGARWHLRRSADQFAVHDDCHYLLRHVTRRRLADAPRKDINEIMKWRRRILNHQKRRLKLLKAV